MDNSVQSVNSQSQFVPKERIDWQRVFTNRSFIDVTNFLGTEYGMSPDRARMLLYKMLSQSSPAGLAPSTASVNATLEKLAQNKEILRAAVIFGRESGDVKAFSDGLAKLPQATHKQAPVSTDQLIMQDTASHNLLQARLATQGSFQPGPEIKPDALYTIMLSKLVTSPRDFASWLANNKSAFIALKSNPDATMLLMAIANPRINMQPVLLAELTKLLANLIRLKLGTSATESLDEEVKFDKRQESLLEESNKAQSSIQGLVSTASGMGIGPLKDFLLEAERFAEEEVANKWSIVLKQEREIGQRILNKFREFTSR